MITNHLLSDQDAEAVCDILVEQLGVARNQLTAEAKMQADLNADSLDQMEIAMALEDRFKVSIPEDQLPSDPTVGELMATVAGLLPTR